MIPQYNFGRRALNLRIAAISFWVVLVYSPAWGQKLAAPNPRPKGTISREAETLFERMREQGNIDFENAIGGYVHRIFNHVTQNDRDATLAAVRKGLEQAKKYRIGATEE